MNLPCLKLPFNVRTQIMRVDDLSANGLFIKIFRPD